MSDRVRFSGRRAAAVAAGKVAGSVSRFLGKGGGTALPGLVALRVDPLVVRDLTSQIAQGSVIVSGTNGKTTTSRMLAAITAKAGLSPLRNETGSNLIRGLAASLIRHASTDGNLKGDDTALGLFEVDEAAIPEVVTNVMPRSVLLLNLFRDQLDRYGEVATVARLWESSVRGLPPSSALVANADDPLVTEVASSASAPLYFGIESAKSQGQSREHASDVKSCPHCSGPIDYSIIFLGHLGHYRCSKCEFTRPRPQVRAESVELMGIKGSVFQLVVGDNEATVHYPLPGLYNVYNALGASAVATTLDISVDTIAETLQSVTPAFGRMERLQVGDRTVVLALAKNPTGLNEVLRTLPSEEGLNLLVMLNDKIADGLDVSWIWDADIEMLRCRAQSVVFSGTRADDMALRFKYADIIGGSSPVRYAVVSETQTALDRALQMTPPAGFLFIIATYTAMLDVRGKLSDRGYVKRYWEE